MRMASAAFVRVRMAHEFQVRVVVIVGRRDDQQFGTSDDHMYLKSDTEKCVLLIVKLFSFG